MVAFLGALLLAVGLFLVIPLTQALHVTPKPAVTYRDMAVAPPPPPKLPPPPEEASESVNQVLEQPKLEQQVEQLEVQQLEVSMNPGLGASLTMGVQGMQFDTSLDVVGDIEKIFEFAELSMPPSLINKSQIRPKFPRSLARRGVQKVTLMVEVLIDESGRTTLQQILSNSYPNQQIKAEARRLAESFRWTVTRMDGRPVKVRAKFPLVLEAPK